MPVLPCGQYVRFQPSRFRISAVWQVFFFQRNFSNKPQATSGYCSDQGLRLSGVADCPPHGKYPAAQCRLRNGATTPHSTDHVVFGDNPIPVFDKMLKQAEHLRLNGNAIATGTGCFVSAVAGR